MKPLLPSFSIPLMIAAAIFLSSAMSHARTEAVITTATPLRGNNGEQLVTLQPGTKIQIIGAAPSSEDSVISYSDPYGRVLVGMVPSGSFIAIRGSEGASSTPPSAAPAVTETRPAAPPPDLSQKIDARDFSEFVKADKVRSNNELRGRRVTLSGTILTARMETLSGGGQSPVLTLDGGPGNPKVKVRLSPAIVRDKELLKKYKTMPSWYYENYDQKVDFRNAGADRIEIRSTFKRSTSYNYSGSTSTYTTSYKSSSEWTPLFTPGDPVSVEASFKSMMLDIELEGGYLVEDSPSSRRSR